MVAGESGERGLGLGEGNVRETSPGMNCYVQRWADTQVPEESLLSCGQPTIREFE
jgi:hypothetical protein